MPNPAPFGDTSFSGTIAPTTPVVQPAVDQSGETFASGLANGFKDLNAIFTTSQQNNAQKNSHINAGVASQITENLNLLSDGVDQGKYTRAQALTKARVLQNQLMADNPGQEEFIQKYINETMGASGLVANLAEDTPQEKANKIEQQAAFQLGWSMSPDATTEEQIANYRQHKSDLQAVQDVATKISLIQAKGDILTATVKTQATMALHSAIDSGLPWVQTQIDMGFKQLNGVTDPAQRAAIIADVESKITSQTAVVDNLRTKSNNAIDTSYMTAGYKALLDDFKNVANGTETQAQYDNSSKLQEAMIHNMVMLDAPTAAAVTMSKLTGFATPEQTEAMTAGAIKITQQLTGAGKDGIISPGSSPAAGSNYVPDVVSKENDVALAFDDVAAKVKNMVAAPDKVDGDATKEMNATITGMFKSVARHSYDKMDPTELNQFMKFMADPAVGAWIEKNMKDIAPQVSQDAAYIVNKNYEDVGVKLINERWGAAQAIFDKTTGGQIVSPRQGANASASLSGVAIPSWSGAGIQFTIDPAFKNNPTIVAQVKKLNDDVAGPLNNMVRAGAHMAGTRDYAKYYEEHFAQRLWVSGEDVPGSITDLKAANATPNHRGDTSPSNDYFSKVMKQESGGNANASNPDSTASGSFGILDSTYNYYAAKLGLTGPKNDLQNQTAVMRALTADNDQALKANGLAVNNYNRYALHFLGSGDGPEVLNAPDTALLSNYVSAKVLKANPRLADMTVADFKKWMKGIVE